ncbi:MAG: carboxymuconolactone decarboxylase family protein [Pseudodesulfovibrio sp.]|nr:carboxymuconolactone decarboxylase family protein [Pseudodesulfovibrio sp.]
MGKLEEFESIRKNAKRFLDLTPSLKDSFFQYYDESYKPGAMDTKTKRLMALCGGIVSGCTGCTLGQLDMAIQEGATTEEVLETCTVAISLGGTLAWSQVSMVVEYLDANGMTS